MLKWTKGRSKTTWPKSVVKQYVSWAYWQLWQPCHVICSNVHPQSTSLFCSHSHSTRSPIIVNDNNANRPNRLNKDGNDEIITEPMVRSRPMICSHAVYMHQYRLPSLSLTWHCINAYRHNRDPSPGVFFRFHRSTLIIKKNKKSTES